MNDSTHKNCFETKEEYLAMIKEWKQTFKDSRKLERNEFGNKKRKLTDLDFFIYALLRGTDPRKCYHTTARFEEAIADMEWRMKWGPDRFMHYLKKFGDHITYDHFLKSWEMFKASSEEAA